MPSLIELINLDWNLYALAFGAALYGVGLVGIILSYTLDLKPGWPWLRVLVLAALVNAAGGFFVVTHLP